MIACEKRDKIKNSRKKKKKKEGKRRRRRRRRKRQNIVEGSDNGGRGLERDTVRDWADSAAEEDEEGDGPGGSPLSLAGVIAELGLARRRRLQPAA